MRAIKLIILLLFLTTSISTGLMASVKVSAGLDLKKRLISSGDTSSVNKYARLVLKLASKKIDPKYLKAYIDSAELICRKENLEIPALLHLARAEFFFLSNDYNNSSQEATIALKLAKSNGETETIARTMIFLGRYCLRTGYYKEGIDYLKNAINLAQKERLKGFIPLGYRALADVYYRMGKTKGYNSSLQMSINAGYKENDTFYIKTGNYFLGTSWTGENRNYRKANSLENPKVSGTSSPVNPGVLIADSLLYRDFNKADSLLRKCLEISIKQKDTSFIILSYANLGWNFYREEKYDSAVKSYNKSLAYSIPAKRIANSANAYGNLGTVFRDMGVPELSLKYYNKSIDLAKQAGDVYNLYWVYLDMSDMYLLKRDTSNAFKCYVLYKKFNDIYLSNSNTQGLTDAKIRYDADSHNKELQLLSLRVSNQRLLIYGSTGLFILSAAIFILLFSRAKINSKRRISEMNRKISEVTQANLRQQMNPHFIFNTLNSIQYYMYQHDKLATNNYLTKFSSLMRKVLENSQHTSVPLRDELDALNLYLELEKIRFKDKFDYQIIIDEEIDTILYKVPTMLIQPYVENSICHGLMPREGNGLVKIDLELKKDYILCVIEDNGIGREAAQEKKMKNDKNHSSLGTQIVTSRLDLVNTLYGTSLKTVYTDLKNDRGEPVGTRVEIHIPILT